MFESFIVNIEPRKWTIGAVNCYKRGCNCDGCFIKETYKDTLGKICYMKRSVKKLIREQGLPEDTYYENSITEDD